jgi:hypothetical protein
MNDNAPLPSNEQAQAWAEAGTLEPILALFDDLNDQAMCRFGLTYLLMAMGHDHADASEQFELLMRRLSDAQACLV